MEVELELLCQCQCEKDKNIDEKSKKCSKSGDFVCGECHCQNNHYGEKCQCDSKDLEKKENAELCLRYLLLHVRSVHVELDSEIFMMTFFFNFSGTDAFVLAEEFVNVGNVFAIEKSLHQNPKSNM